MLDLVCQNLDQTGLAIVWIHLVSMSCYENHQCADEAMFDEHLAKAPSITYILPCSSNTGVWPDLFESFKSNYMRFVDSNPEDAKHCFSDLFDLAKNLMEAEIDPAWFVRHVQLDQVIEKITQTFTDYCKRVIKTTGKITAYFHKCDKNFTKFPEEWTESEISLYESFSSRMPTNVAHLYHRGLHRVSKGKTMLSLESIASFDCLRHLDTTTARVLSFMIWKNSVVNKDDGNKTVETQCEEGRDDDDIINPSQNVSRHSTPSRKKRRIVGQNESNVSQPSKYIVESIYIHFTGSVTLCFSYTP